MMDVVSALSKYRKSVLDDESTYFVMHVIYKDPLQTEAGIEHLTGVPSGLLKKMIRELYQASFIKMHGEGRVSLTNFAENVLAKLGADSVVIPTLINELIPKSNSEHVHVLATWTLNAEPERSQTITQALRNLKIYAANRSLSEEIVRHSSMLCIVPSYSKSRALLQADISARGIFHHFSGHVNLDNNVWIALTKDYREATDIADASDMILINACSRLTEWSQVSEPVSEFLSFRAYNYVFSSERDQILESCVRRMPEENAHSVWAAIWGNVRGLFDTFAKYLFPYQQSIENEQDLVSAIKRRVAVKQENAFDVLDVFAQSGPDRFIDQMPTDLKVDADDHNNDA